MAKTDNLTDYLIDLAEGIRAKKGTTEPINPQDFRKEIESIEGGGSGGGSADVVYIKVNPNSDAHINTALIFGDEAKLLNTYNGEVFCVNPLSLMIPEYGGIEGIIPYVNAVSIVGLDVKRCGRMLEDTPKGGASPREFVALMGLDLDDESVFPRLTKEQFYNNDYIA